MNRAPHNFLARTLSITITFSLLASSCAPHKESGQTGGAAWLAVDTTNADFPAPWTGRSRTYPMILALVKTVGSDPAKQLAYVSNEISFEPYVGALRGPLGTMWAAAGNSTDKSLVLAAMRKASDGSANVRFASCTLSADQAGQLVDRWLNNQQRIPKLLTANGSVRADPKLVSQVRSALSTWRALVESTSSQAEELAGQLRTANLNSAADIRGKLIAATTPHVWLQIQEQGTWVDADPTIGEAGKQWCVPEQTMADLPENWYHHIAINIRAETRSNGALASRYLMQTGWRTADLVGSTIAFTFSEPFGFRKVPAPSAPSGYAAYTPVLAVDNALGVGQPIILPTPPLGASHGIQGETATGFNAIGNALGAIGGSEAPSPAASVTASSIPEVTGVWLSFEIAGPNGYRQIAEEPIFDRIGFAQRALGHAKDAPLGSLVLDGGEYAALARLWSLTPWVGERYAPLTGLDSSAPPPGVAGAFQVLGATGRAYYALRQTLADAAEHKGALKVATAGPSIGVLTFSNAGASYDRLYDDVVVTEAGGEKGSVPSGVLWGVASLQAERYVMAAASQPGGGTGVLADAEGHDVATVFARAKASNVAVVAFHPTDTGTIPSVDASPEARLRMLGQLFDGRSILAPQSNITLNGQSTYGWWNISAQTGILEDEMADGGHDAATEEAVLEGSSVQKIPATTRLANAIAKVYCEFVPIVGVISMIVSFGMLAQQGIDLLRGKTQLDLESLLAPSALASILGGWVVSHVFVSNFSDFNCASEESYTFKPKPNTPSGGGKTVRKPRPMSKTKIELPQPAGPTAKTVAAGGKSYVYLPKPAVQLPGTLSPSEFAAGAKPLIWLPPVQGLGPGGIPLDF